MNKTSDLVILPYLAISKKVLYAKTVWLVSRCHIKLKDIHKFMSYSTKYFLNKLATHSYFFLLKILRLFKHVQIPEKRVRIWQKLCRTANEQTGIANQEAEMINST